MYTPVYNKRLVLKFKQFNNRGYSLFNVLGKEVIIGVLSVATLRMAAAAAPVVSAHTEPEDTSRQHSVMMSEVSIVGTRAPLTVGRQARMVTVLRRSDIEAAPVQSVNDLLKYVSGVDVRQKGPLGALADVSIRGGNSEQVAILLNGINVCDPQTGHNAMDLPVALGEIERVEVVEGPAARAYGTSSLLGGINIVTRVPSGCGAEGRVEGGSYGYLATEARAYAGQERWGNQLSASFLRSDGYQRAASGTLNSDYRAARTFYQGRYDAPDVAVRWQAGMSLRGLGSNTYYSAHYDDQYERTFKTFMAVRGENVRGALRFRPAVYWNHQEDRFELVRGSEVTVPFNYHRTEVLGLNLNAYFDWPLGRTAFGAEMRYEHIISTNLGELLNKPRPIRGTNREYTHGLERTNTQFFLEHNLAVGRFTLSAGLTAVTNSQADMSMRVYPGVDVACRIGSLLTAYAGYNASLRMPSFTELYYSVGGHKADSHLKPEELSAVEAGLRLADDVWQADVGVFFNRYRNLIDWISDGETDGQGAPLWKSVNFGHIRALGVRASVRLDAWRMWPGQRVLERLSADYAWLGQRAGTPDGIVSKSSLEYLKNKVVVQGDFRPCRPLLLRVGWRLQHRMGGYVDALGVPHSYATYAVWDARLQWDARRWAMYVEGNNLLGRSYLDYGNVRQPGFWLVGGISWRLGGVR